MLESIIGIICMVVVGFISFYLFRILFKKTGSAEIFFVTLFFFSFLFEMFRIGMYLVEMGGVLNFLGLPGTRLVFAGRLFGLLCLFTASLYSGNFSYQKFEILIGIALLISGLLAFSISFDQTILLSNGLLRMGDEAGLFIIFTSLKLLLAANFCISSTKKHVFRIVSGIGLLIIGRDLLLFAPDPLLLAAGVAVVVAGMVITYRNLENYYSWI